jgi:hypothetical protein
MSLEEATISNMWEHMWEIAALGEVLEQKGSTKQDLYDIIAELRKKSPRAHIAETVFPSLYGLADGRESDRRCPRCPESVGMDSTCAE